MGSRECNANLIARAFWRLERASRPRGFPYAHYIGRCQGPADDARHCWAVTDHVVQRLNNPGTLHLGEVVTYQCCRYSAFTQFRRRARRFYGSAVPAGRKPRAWAVAWPVLLCVCGMQQYRHDGCMFARVDQIITRKFCTFGPRSLFAGFLNLAAPLNLPASGDDHGWLLYRASSRVRQHVRITVGGPVECCTGGVHAAWGDSGWYNNDGTALNAEFWRK